MAAAAAGRVFDAVICGGGITGISAARHLLRAHPDMRVALVTAHAPMSYTSSLSTECFRDHWPSARMRDFMARSIALLEQQRDETGDAFRMTQRGYLYLSSAPNAGEVLRAEALQCHGEEGTFTRAGAASIDAGYAARKRGADVLLGSGALQAAFPFLSPDLTAGLHARNCGWISAQTAGMLALEELQGLVRPSDGQPALRVLRGKVARVDTGPDCAGVRSVTVEPLADAAGGGGGISEPVTLQCGVFVNAAGPYLAPVHEALFPPGLVASQPATRLPVHSEVHAKVVFRDALRVIPRSAPMVICNDEISLPWSDEEREGLAEALGEDVAARLTGPLPPGAHFRPYGGEGSDAVLMLWEAWHHGLTAGEGGAAPPDSVLERLDHELYPEVVLRGLSRVVPDLAAYFDPDYQRRHGSHSAAEAGTQRKPTVDGGYYTKTPENIPLVGPAPGPGGQGAIPGAYICGAVSGYGLMAGPGAGELLAQHVGAGTAAMGTRSLAAGDAELRLPPWARLFSPLRYQDAEFTRPGGVREQLLRAGSGQL